MPEQTTGTQETTQSATQQTQTTGAAEQTTQGQQTDGTQGQQTQRTGAVQNQGDPRYDGMLRDLKSERTERQRIEKEFKDLKDSIDGRNRKMGEALGIVQPENDQELQQIRQQFAKVFPKLAQMEALEKLSVEELEDLIGNSKQIKSTADHYWVERGQQVVDAITADIQKEIGGELTEDQIDDMAHAYVRFVTKGGDAMRQRHEREPLKVAKEFAKAYSDRWFAPARRKVSQQADQRFGRPIPRGSKGAPVTQQKQKIDFNNEDAFKDALKESFRNGVEQ